MVFRISARAAVMLGLAGALAGCAADTSKINQGLALCLLGLLDARQ